MMMKLSIWQQFSSNHSTGFTAIGKFDTPAEAEHAASEIRRLMTALVEYYSDKEHMDAVRESDGETIPMTPVEQIFAAKYGLDKETWITAWEGAGIDWVFKSTQIDEAVHQFDRYVCVSNLTGYMTWLGDEPFATLLKRMGGQVASEDGEVVVLMLDIICTAPDAPMAETLYAQLDAYFKTMPPFNPFTTIDEMPSLDETAQSGAAMPALTEFPNMVAGSIARDGMSLIMKGIHFRSEIHLWRGVSQLATALRARGCTDIQFTFVEVINPDASSYLGPVQQ